MIESYGRSLRQVVADTATVLFDLDPPLGKEDVTRLAHDAKSIPTIDLDVLRCWSERVESIVEESAGIPDEDDMYMRIIDAVRAKILRDPEHARWLFKKWKLSGIVGY